MADQSVFKMSGAASEKLAALQNLSFSERTSTYEQDLSKLVCSFMRPATDVNPVQRTTQTTANLVDSPGGICSRTGLPFNIIKPAESWSEVGVRTVADLKTAMSSQKKAPAAKKSQQSCDRGVDWRLRSSLYFDFHNERTVRLPYDIPGLAERAESPPLAMEGCTDLTSSEVINAMRVLEPPKRPTPCRPHASPRGHSPPRPEGTLPLANFSVSTADNVKTPVLLNPEPPTVKPPVSTPSRKARMKFTKRRSDLEKNPLTGLLEPKDGLIAAFGAPPFTTFEFVQAKEPLSENNSNNNNSNNGSTNNNNNNDYIDKYSEGFVQDFRSEYASSVGSASSGISIDRRDSFDSSTPRRTGSVDWTQKQKRHKNAMSESSCQDSVISSSERNPPQKQRPPTHEPAAEDSQDVEFFDLTIAESGENSGAAQDKLVLSGETTCTAQKVPKEVQITQEQAKQTQTSIPVPISTGLGTELSESVKAKVQESVKSRVPDVALKQDAATQTQQSMPQQNSSAAVDAKEPKMIDLLGLYKAVTLMKSNKAQPGSPLDSDLFLVKGQLAPRAPEGMHI